MTFPLVDHHPWGHGALAVETPEPGWCCPHCGLDRNRRIRKRENMIARHVYLYGPPRCTICADTWCATYWP